MASIDAAGDPLSTAASATCLLLWTLGPAASAASPSRSRGALLDGSLKGSKELVKQARLTMKEHGDIQKLYQEDGVKVAAAENGKNNQQGRRPALDRKRARFTLKAPPSNPVQNVDFSQLLSIEDPEEYFSTLEQLEKADKEIKKLRGDVPTETTDNHRAIEPPKKRPGMSRRKSAHSYKFSVGAHTTDVIEAPASQIGTITESQFTQDDIPASVPERTKMPVPSSSSLCDIPDISMRQDSFAEKDKSATWDNLMSEFKNLDESEEENLLREKLQLKEISIGKVCLPDLFNVPDGRPVSTTVRENPTSGHTPERPVLGGHHDRISQWEKHIFGGDILQDKADLSKDDESDGSPETAKSKQLLARSSYDAVVLTAGEASAARETPSLSAKSPYHILEPEPSIPNGVSSDEKEPGNPSLGACIDSEVAKEKDASSRHNVSLEEDDVPIDHPDIEKPNHETEVSSPHHLEVDSTEMLGSAPGRNASADHNFEHQGVVGGIGLRQDKPIHPPEILPEDIDPHNQSHIHDGSVQKQAVDISNELSLSKDGKRKSVRKGKNKKQPSKRGKRVADEASHPLEMPPTNVDTENQPGTQDINVEEVVGRNELFQDKPIPTSEIAAEDIHPHNQSHMDDVNIEKRAADVSNELLLSKDSKQKTARNGKTKKQPSKRGKRVADEASYPLGLPSANCDPEAQPNLQDTNTEQQAVGTSDPWSPDKGTGEKEAQRRNTRQELNGRKSLTGFGLAWQCGVRRSTRIRSRPLEDWRGERFLYGRIHDTMATVIGIKSYSPSQDGKTAMRVKSFVPEQYSDIVAQAAKY